MQPSSFRSLLVKAMMLELERRFRFHRQFAIPSKPATSAKFRACMAELLWTPWDPALTTEKMTNLQHLFNFFNGNLLDTQNWEHWCRGPQCCKDAASSLQKAPSV